MSNENKKIAVVGAGIVGCSCALWLQKKGFSVVLIDPEDPGSGTSSGNACTIADYACVPVNNPGLIKRLPWLMFSSDSPLSVSPRYAMSNLLWMIAFLRNCSEKNVARISRSLAEISSKTYEGLDPLVEMSAAQDLIKQRGCMYVYRTEAEFQSGARANQVRRDNGVEFTELDSNDIRQLEPNLKIEFPRGLLFNKASQVVNPQSLVTRYFECFQRNNGQYIRQRALEVNPDLESVKVQLDNGETLAVDRVVIAAGAFSKQIKGIKAHEMPLDTERGYHVQFNGMQHLLNRPVSWNEAGFYATPMDQGMRIAGTVEIAGYSTQKNPRNLNYLINKGREMLELPEQPDQQWLGYRPTFPDALPVIGHSPVSENILFAFGHQHIGLTLAGITGKIIAELANMEKPSHNIAPFSPGRFL
jgi:glycine/D-amino acid oxidase-like deaminating enzyme